MTGPGLEVDGGLYSLRTRVDATHFVVEFRVPWQPYQEQQPAAQRDQFERLCQVFTDWVLALGATSGQPL